jgi:hypothetical protein
MKNKLFFFVKLIFTYLPDSSTTTTMRNDILCNNMETDFSTEDILVDKNSMPEDDPNGNTLHDAHEIRWGPQHAGAKLLASQYTKGNIKSH